MIRYKDTILEDFFIDPITAIITNSKGEIQKTYIKRGRAYFKRYKVHEWQMHTHVGYKQGYIIHHLDHNKMNNSLSNLVYITRSEHNIIHKKGNKNMFGKHHSEESKKKLSEINQGKKHPFFGKHHTEEANLKMSEAAKGRTLSKDTKRKIGEANKIRNNDRIWINNGIVNKFVKCEYIPEGFVKGMLKRKNDK